MDRISYIDNVVDFMHAETSTGLVKCVDLYNKVMMKFPEWNLVFNRHPYHNYISKTPSEEYNQLYCDRDEKYIKTRYDNEKSFSVCVGTNEDIEYDNGKCLLQNMSVTELTDDEANVLAKLFSSYYGNIQVFETISYLLYNADSDEFGEENEG